MKVSISVVGTVIVGVWLCISLLYLLGYSNAKFKGLKSYSTKAQKQRCSTVCVTKHCLYTAADVVQNLESAIDPCSDFYRYSCGRYSPSESMATSVPLELNLNFLRNVRALLESVSVGNIESAAKNVFAEVRKVFGNCMNNTLTNTRSVKSLMRLVSEMGAPGWPNLLLDWVATGEDIFGFLSDLVTKGEDSLIELKRLELVQCWDIPDAGPNCSNPIEVTLAESRLILDFQAYLTNTTTHELEEYKKMIKTLLGLFNLYDEPADEYVSEILLFEKRIAALIEESRNRSRQRRQMDKASLETYNLSWNERNVTRKLLPFVKTCLEKVGIEIKSENLKISVRDGFLMEQLLLIFQDVPQRVLANYLILRLVLNHVYELSFPIRSIMKNNEIYRRMDRYHALKENWEMCVSWCLEKFTPLLGYIYELQYFNLALASEVHSIYESLKISFYDVIERVEFFDVDFKKFLKNRISDTRLFVSRYHHTNETPPFLFHYKDVTFVGETFLENVVEYNQKSWKRYVNSVFSQRDQMRLSYILGVNAQAREDTITVGIGFMQYPMLGNMRSTHVDVAKIGQVMAHEMGHVFYMAIADYPNTTATTRNELMEFHKCLTSRYYNFKQDAESGSTIDGNRTFSENFADLLGVYITFSAYQHLAETRKLPMPPELNLSHDQQFFVFFSQMFCEMPTKKESGFFLRDPHSPSKYRVIGPLSNFQGFSDSFRCTAGSEMNSKSKCDFTRLQTAPKHSV